MLIIPWRDKSCSIEMGKSELTLWPQKPFLSSFKIDKTHYSLIVDSERNITLTTGEDKITVK